MLGRAPGRCPAGFNLGLGLYGDARVQSLSTTEIPDSVSTLVLQSKDKQHCRLALIL
jgi:hypothetical protein